MRVLLTLATVAALFFGASDAMAEDDLTSLATSYRYEGMCRWAREKSDDRFIGYAKRPENWGQTPSDYVYNQFFHVLKRGVNDLGRQGNFYQALCGIILLEADFNAGEAGALKQQVDYIDGFLKLKDQGADIAKLFAEARDNPNLRKLLRGTDRGMAQAVRAHRLLQGWEAVETLRAATDDIDALLLAPIVAADHSVDIVEAIKASTGDADIARACDGVLGELTTGRKDYLSRLENVAANGKLAPMVTEALAKSGVSWTVANTGLSQAVRTFLSELGMKASAGSVGAVAGSCFAAFVGGMELGFWATGETAAFEHARLAHFAAYIQPGLGERWLKLKGEVSADDADRCADFDAATRALVLLNGYINQETGLMARCYANAVVKLSGFRGVSTPSMEGFAKAYRQWGSGKLFASEDDEAVANGDLSTPGTRTGEERQGPDGGTYVWVPPGEFMMGSEYLGDASGPVHRVNITQGFWISQCEVTNAQYARFLNAHGSNTDDAGHELASFERCCDIRLVGATYSPEAGKELRPVESVAWYGAKAYCDEYGLSLPTEAEWEYAARGPRSLNYPWGNEWDPMKCCNDIYLRTVLPVGSCPQGASWCGALDLAGNVTEWCNDRWDGGYWGRLFDSLGEPTPKWSVRGGDWNSDSIVCLSFYRTGDASDCVYDSVGFRPVRRPDSVLRDERAPTGVGTPKADAGDHRTSTSPDAPGALASPGTAAGEEREGPDGGTYVWVPPGEFMMGSEDTWGDDDQGPVHRVRITRGFWLGKHEVTNAQYRGFCETTRRGFPFDSDQGDDHPVVEVTWDDAKAYCDHYGLRLPTEAEWEYAASGAEGRRWPWGDEWDTEKCCNCWSRSLAPGGKTCRVGSFSTDASWCGALDLAGNVEEWCSDWYGRDYYAESPIADPPGPQTGKLRVLRGGSWEGPFAPPILMRRLNGCADRGQTNPLAGMDWECSHVGFRCAMTP